MIQLILPTGSVYWLIPYRWQPRVGCRGSRLRPAAPAAGPRLGQSRRDLQSFLPRFAIVDPAREHDSTRAAELCAGLQDGEIVLFLARRSRWAHSFTRIYTYAAPLSGSNATLANLLKRGGTADGRGGGIGRPAQS